MGHVQYQTVTTRELVSNHLRRSSPSLESRWLHSAAAGRFGTVQWPSRHHPAGGSDAPPAGHVGETSWNVVNGAGGSMKFNEVQILENSWELVQWSSMGGPKTRKASKKYWRLHGNSKGTRRGSLVIIGDNSWLMTGNYLKKLGSLVSMADWWHGAAWNVWSTRRMDGLSMFQWVY